MQRVSLLGSLLMSVLLLGCGSQGHSKLNQQQYSSSIDSVNIEQSPVEDQMKIGFCWAYATVALVESQYKMRSHKDINLSEEALGFYRMAEGLHLLANESPQASLIQNLQAEDLEGWIIKNDTPMPDAMTLVEKYGLVPESVWTFKFTSRTQTDRIKLAIKKAFLQLVRSQPAGKVPTIAEVISHVMTAPGAFPSAPPTSFVFQGQSYSSTAFATQALDFHSSDYEVVIANGFADYDKIVAATKRALVRGLSVPLGYPVNFSRLQNGVFSGQSVDVSNPKNFMREGGHAVLITDFVNKGGKPGALTQSQLEAEIKKTSSELDYFVFKNSWGKGARSNEGGLAVNGSESGYYAIDQAYLRGSSGVGQILSVVVPRDIAADPFGNETINPLVAKLVQ